VNDDLMTGDWMSRGVMSGWRILNRLRRRGAGRSEDDPERDSPQKPDQTCHGRSPTLDRLRNRNSFIHAPMAKKSK
jgi:hypothetical protein